MFRILKNLFSQGSSENLAKLIHEGALLIDVRSPSEFLNGSVKGAINIPLEKLSDQLSRFKDKKHIIVFCRSGNRSNQAKSILNKNGFTNVTNGGTWKDVNEFITSRSVTI